MKMASCNNTNKKTIPCAKLARIIGGIVITSDDVCVVQRLRNIKPTI